MKKSLRRIASILLVLSVVGLCVGFMGSLSIHCGSGEKDGCLANLYWGVQYSTPYEPDLGTAQSTATVLSPNIGWVIFIQLVSGYALLIAIGILIVLESIELHYIRKALQMRQKFRLRLF